MYLGYDLVSHMRKVMLPTYTLNLNATSTLNLNHVSTLNLKPLLNLNSPTLKPLKSNPRDICISYLNIKIEIKKT
jgi:hypothetical protein